MPQTAPHPFGATSPQAMGARRFGRMNWLGTWTLAARETRRFMAVWQQTVAAPLEEVCGQLDGPAWMISAQNPYELRLDDATNRRRHRALVDLVTRRCVAPVLQGVGRAPGEDGWREDMVLVQGLTRSDALELAALHGQRSVFEIEDDELRVLETRTGTVRRTRRLRA